MPFNLFATLKSFTTLQKNISQQVGCSAAAGAHHRKRHKKVRGGPAINSVAALAKFCWKNSLAVRWRRTYACSRGGVGCQVDRPLVRWVSLVTAAVVSLLLLGRISHTVKSINCVPH